MTDAKVNALRDEVNRRFGTIEADIKRLYDSVGFVQEQVLKEKKERHNEIVQARREERDATAETVQGGVNEARQEAVAEAAERVAEVRDSIREDLGRVFTAGRDAFR